MTDFPVLDSIRDPDGELGRTVIDADLDPIEPYIDEMDDWCTMPLRKRRITP